MCVARVARMQRSYICIFNNKTKELKNKTNQFENQVGQSELEKRLEKVYATFQKDLVEIYEKNYDKNMKKTRNEVLMYIVFVSIFVAISIQFSLSLSSYEDEIEQFKWQIERERSNRNIQIEEKRSEWERVSKGIRGSDKVTKFIEGEVLNVDRISKS